MKTARATGFFCHVAVGALWSLQSKRGQHIAACPSRDLLRAERRLYRKRITQGDMKPKWSRDDYDAKKGKYMYRDYYLWWQRQTAASTRRLTSPFILFSITGVTVTSATWVVVWPPESALLCMAPTHTAGVQGRWAQRLSCCTRREMSSCEQGSWDRWVQFMLKRTDNRILDFFSSYINASTLPN